MATLAEYQTQLDGWFDVLTKLKNGKEARRGDRVWKSSEVKEVRETIDWLEGKVRDLERGDGSGDIIPRSMIPIDDI